MVEGLGLRSLGVRIRSRSQNDIGRGKSVARDGCDDRPTSRESAIKPLGTRGVFVRDVTFADPPWYQSPNTD